MIFDAEQITELLGSDKPHFRTIAEKNIVDHFDMHSRLFFDRFAHHDCSDDLIRYACQRFPAFIGGFGKPAPNDFNKKYAYFADYAAAHQLFFDKLNSYLSDIQSPEAKRRLLLRLFDTFEGLRVDLRNIAPELDYPVESECHSEKQLMIFITGYCNLQCPYCFSRGLKPVEMSLSDFEEILQWASRNGISRISLCGGEPTTHSRFDIMLSLIAKYGLKSYFAGNFTIDCTRMQHFNKETIDRVFVHLTDKVIENQTWRKNLYQNIRHAQRIGILLTGRANISDKKPKINEWLQIITETGLQALNIALTFPTPQADNQFVDIQLFDEYAEIIEKIIDEAARLDVALSFAKPIPPCIFKKRTYQRMSVDNYYPLCGIHGHRYTRNLCITPEKEFHPCMGLASTDLKFSPDMAWQEIENRCRQVVKPLLERPLFEKCGSCFLYNRKLCQGACLSYKSML